MLLVALVAVCTALAAIMPVAAQTDDASTCRARKGAGAVAACTRLIESGKAKGVELYLQHNDRGGAYQSIGTDSDHYRAIEDFNKAVGLDPKLPYAFINRGVSWATLGAYDRAIEDFAQALRVAPKDARAYNNRGGAYRDRGEFDRAIADFNKAIALDPKLADALFNRGTVYMQKEDYNRAIADYSAVIRQSPRDILALAARGRAWSSKEDFGRAKLDYEAALAAPAEDQQTRAVQEAVRELLRALLEKRAAVEEEAARTKRAAAEKAAQEKQAALDAEIERQKLAALEKQAAAEKKAAEDKQAALDKQAAAEKKAAEQKLAAQEKQAAAEKKAAEQKLAAQEKQAAAEKKAAEDKQAALDKQAAAEKEAAEQKQAALEKKAAAEKKAAEEKQAALQKSIDPPRRIDRIALVIGNAAYLPSLGALGNPGNDAKDVAKVLTQLGFTVWLRLDLGHVEIKDTLATFARVAHDVETVVVYFAGHGFQYGGSNYLAPVDAPVTDDSSIADHVSLDTVMTDLRAERGFRILIIDACRNNLAVEEAVGRQAPGARAILIKRGLSPVTIASTWGGGGMLIAFATLPGDVASDGAGRNSPFAHALVKHLPTPALELRHLFIRVRAEVVAATAGRQIPQVSDSLNGEYVFKAARQR